MVCITDAGVIKHMKNNIDKIDWHILNLMADDWESALTIQQDLKRDNIDLTIGDIIERLEKLHSDGLVELNPETKNLKNKWYGMTERGRSIGDEYAKSHGYDE